MWLYRELYSCPLVVYLGMFKYKDLEGYTVLTVLNYRVNVLVDDNGRVRLVSNIPIETWRKRIEEICMKISLGKIEELDLPKKVEAYAMFYGGINSYVVVENALHILLLDFVNKAKLWFYIQPRDFNMDIRLLDLRDISLIHLALREGLVELLRRVCEFKGSTHFLCELKSSHGILYVAEKPVEGAYNMIQVIPDNVPLRHVVSFKALADRSR